MAAKNAILRAAKWMALVVCLFAMAGLWEYARWIRSEQYLSQELDKTVIPRIDFRETTVQDALAYCQLCIQKQNPHLRHIAVKFDPHYGNAADVRITLSLRDIPARVAIEYVCALSDSKAYVGGPGVTVKRRNDGTVVAPAKFHWWP